MMMVMAVMAVALHLHSSYKACPRLVKSILACTLAPIQNPQGRLFHGGIQCPASPFGCPCDDTFIELC
jgi:hypothetical protein